MFQTLGTFISMTKMASNARQCSPVSGFNSHSTREGSYFSTSSEGSFQNVANNLYTLMGSVLDSGQSTNVGKYVECPLQIRKSRQHTTTTTTTKTTQRSSHQAASVPKSGVLFHAVATDCWIQLVSLVKFKDISFPFDVKPPSLLCHLCQDFHLSFVLIRYGKTCRHRNDFMKEAAYIPKSLKSEDMVYHAIQGHRGRDGEKSTSQRRGKAWLSRAFAGVFKGRTE